MNDFAQAVSQIRNAMNPWTLPERSAPPEPPSAELLARRRAGKRAYEQAMRNRGVSSQAARIFASASWIFEGVDDD